MSLRKYISELVRCLGGTNSRSRRSRRLSSPESRLRGERLEDRRLLTTIDLAALTAAQGSTIFGADAGDRSGFSVSNAGDMNGDGFDDMIIGAFLAGGSSNSRPVGGDSYVIFGAPSLPGTIELATLATPGGSAGFTIFAADAGDESGFRVSTAGDVNGDGFDDLIIGALYADALFNARHDAGDSYVVFGGGALPARIELATLGTAGGAAGITFFGAESFDRSGISVSSAGDVNGDGFDDLIIGADRADASSNAKPNAGDSYVIFGNALLPGTIDLSTLGTPGGSAGITIFGADADDRSGVSVGSAGDLNGDGFDDLLIGAQLADGSLNATQYAGDSYVIFGGASLPATIDLATLGTPGGAAGITIFGAESYDSSGFSVSRAGDVNGDGFDDLVIGAIYADGSLNGVLQAGDSYVIFGGGSLSTTIDLATLGTPYGPAGITIFGVDAGDYSGRSVSSAGDVNGDGFDDVLVGAYLAAASLNAKPSAGDSYLIFGGASLPATIDLATLGTLGGAAGITIFGADAGDNSGRCLSSAGDVNGDGFDDFLIGANYAAASSNATLNAGESYILFGGDFTAAVTHQGTAADNLLTGSESADVMIGGRGNDTLVSNGGADVLTGGQGNDILAISDLFFARIVGGTGTDTLRFDGASCALDLTLLHDNRILGIEQIDLTGTGNNTLTLNQREVLNLSDESNSLLVQGNSGDHVFLIGDWTRQLDETINGTTYRVFVLGAAQVKSAIATSQPIPNTIDLATLTAAQGATVFGSDIQDYSGVSVSSAGDVNGDGFDDLIIGAFLADASGDAKPNAGESYLIFGSPQLPTTVNLALLGTGNGSAGVVIFGADAADNSGFSVSSAGDVNGDGFDDLLIGSLADGSGNLTDYAGESYVIFGGTSLPATIDLGTLGTPGGSAGITIFGVDDRDFSGYSVSGAGDVNGDGFDDILIGAPFADAAMNAKGNAAGDSYVIFGRAFFPATIDLATLGIPGGSPGTTIFGADRLDRSGGSASNAGDVNGDGFDDLLIGAYLAGGSLNAKPEAGDSYVIFGGASLPATIDLATLGEAGGAAGITIFGATQFDSSGFSVSSAGDVNGDGFDDLLIGAVDAEIYPRVSSGNSYVIFGGALLPSSIDLAFLGTPGGSPGIIIFGAESVDSSGRSLSSAGDVNGDGFDDVLIGAPFADASFNGKRGAGDSYVIFGGTSLPATIDLAALRTPCRSAGITIFGADAFDRSGQSVSSAGDVNGDGFDDFLIGAPTAAASSNATHYAGESYLLFGADFTGAITHQGTSVAEMMIGTTDADVLIGGTSNDILVGSGGADVLTGGQGNDILAITDLTFARVVGGTGTDTLRLDGSGLSLDLTALHDNRLVGIEQIDISGSGNNTLTLNQREVLNLSDESNTLLVRRNAGDVVNIGSGWTEQGLNETIGADVFRVYTQGVAVLKVQAINAAPTAVFLSDTTPTLPENTATASRIRMANVAVTDDGSGTNVLSVSGADAAFFELDGNVLFLRAGTVLNYEVKSSYTVAVNVDDSTVGGSPDASATFTLTLIDVTEWNAIDVQRGQTQRSYLRYLDLVFDRSADLMDLISHGRLQLTKFDLNGENGVVTGLPVATSVSGSRILIDFGTNGIGGSRGTNIGDGYYRIGIDMDGNGSFESAKYFHRLLGDVNGDGRVTSTDKMQVLSAAGTTSAESDVNGDGIVNILDTSLVSRAVGRRLRDGLFRDD